MIAIAPNGTRLEFPEDATESEIDEFLKYYGGEQEGPAPTEQGFIPTIPPETTWPRPGIGPMGPPVPEEVLTHSILAIPGLAAGGLGEVNRAISEMSAEALRGYGVPAYPGVPMVDVGEYPVTAGGPAGWALREFFPEIAKTVDVWAGETLGGFTEPGMAVQVPFGAWKPVAAKFGAEIMATLPETIQAVGEAQTGPEAVKAGLDLAASGFIGAGIGRLLTRPTPPRTPTTMEAINAAKERIIERNRLAQYPQAPERGLPPETGGGYRVTVAAGLEKEAQVLLNEAGELGLFEATRDNPGLSANIEVLRNHGPLDPENAKPFIAGVARIGPDGSIIPGKIRLSVDALRDWRYRLDLGKRRQVLSRALNEEVIHSFVLPEEAYAFWQTLSEAEKQARRELYVGETGLQLNDLLLGHEGLRQELQRILDLDPTEIVEVSGIERLNRYTVEMIARIISRAREWLGTEAAKRGQTIKLDVLNRMDKNVNLLSDVLEQVQNLPPGLMPWAVNRSKAEENRRIIRETKMLTVREAIAALGDKPQYLDNVVDHIVEQRQKLIENRNTVRDIAKAYMATLISIRAQAVSLETFQNAFPQFEAKPEFLAYDKKGKATVRPEDATGWWFTTPEGKNALDNLESGQLKKSDWQGLIDLRGLFGLVNMVERTFEPLGPKSRARFNMTNLSAALAELKSLKKDPETVLQLLDDFQGVALFKKPFFGQFLGVGEFPTIDSAEQAFWVTGTGDVRKITDEATLEVLRNWEEAQLYANQPLVSERINRRFQYLQRAGVAADVPVEAAGAIIHHMLWDKVRGTMTTHEGLYKAIEAATINRRKTRAAAEEATTPLLTEAKTMGKEEWRTYLEKQPRKKGLFPITATYAENFARDYLAGTTGPDFKEFTRKAIQHFGKLKPGAMIDFWEVALRERLMTAPGEDLRGIAKSLGLTRKLRIESREGKLRDVADPPPEMPPEVPGPQIPGVTRPEFVMASRAAFGPYKEKFRPTEPTPQSLAQFTREQRFRATVMAGIFEELMEQTKGRERWRRETVSPDEIADPKIETKQPIYQEFHSEQLKDPDFLGWMLTQDARGYGGEKVRRVEQGKLVEFSRKGIPVSATKRLTALMDYNSKKVYLVGTFRDGRRGPVLIDPKNPSLEASPLSSIMNRYQVIASVLLDEPVQKFKQEFKNVMEYEVEFGKPAYEASKRTERYEPPPGEEYVPPRARYELTEPITEPEAASIMDHIFSEVGVFEGPEDVILSIDALRVQPRGEVISAYSKLANQILEKNPGFTDQQVIEALAKQVYDNHIESASSQAFIERTISQGPAPTGEAAGVAATERAIEREPERVPSAIETEPGSAYRQFLETEYGKIYAGSELRRRPVGASETQPTVPSVRTMVEGQEPASINRLVKTGTKLWDKTIAEGFRAYSEWMNEKLRRVGGPKSKSLADAINTIIDTEKKRYGGLTPWLDPARREAGKPGRATTWMHRLNPVTQTAAIANAVDAIEGTAPIPPYAKKLTNLSRMANLKIGLMYEQANPQFKARGQFQRNLTGFGYDIIRTGSGEAWQSWVEGMAKANNVSPAIIERFFKEWKAILDDPGVDDIMIEKVNQDFHRQFPKAITHIKVDAGGIPIWQPVIHADLFNYLETAARRASHATAFRDIWPNTKSGRRAFGKLMDEVRAELSEPYQRNLTSLMRALQGHPTDSYTRLAVFRAGEPAGEAVKFVNQTLGNAFARLVLTGQMFVQPGENIAGAVPVFFGYRNYLEAIARLMRGGELYALMEIMGSVNRVILDYSYDPTSPVRSVFKISGNVLSRVFMEQFLNELQEASAAATAHVVRERIVQDKLSRWEKMMLPRTFRAMGFDSAQIQRMMRGDKALLDQFEAKASAFLTSGNKAIAEGSAIGSNRLFNSVFRFQSYPMMKANQLRKVFSGWSEAMSGGTPKEKAAATMLLGRFLIGGAMQGALTVGLTALAYEGLHGLLIRKQEAQDDMLQFVTESFLGTMSGPLYLVYRGGLYKGLPGIGEQALRTFFPYSVLQELWNFSWGAGHYRDLDAYDRIRKFVKMKIPGSKAITTGLSVLGLSMENKKLDAAMNAFYRWRIEEQGMGGAPPTLWEDDSKEFRIQLKKAVEALKRGDDEGYAEALSAAFDASTKKGQLKAALTAKTVLTNPKGGKLTPEEMESLRNRIGDEYVDLLEDYDFMIKQASGRLR